MFFLVENCGSFASSLLVASARYLCRVEGVICWKKGERVFDDDSQGLDAKSVIDTILAFLTLDLGFDASTSMDLYLLATIAVISVDRLPPSSSGMIHGGPP